MIKSQKGITLVALIITIIVMLILAGVSISLVLDEKGVLSKAQSVEPTQIEAAIREAAALANADIIADYYSDTTATKGVNASEVGEYMKNNFSYDKDDLSVTVSGSNVTIEYNDGRNVVKMTATAAAKGNGKNYIVISEPEKVANN